jgi:hypothetical protein
MKIGQITQWLVHVSFISVTGIQFQHMKLSYYHFTSVTCEKNQECFTKVEWKIALGASLKSPGFQVLTTDLTVTLDRLPSPSKIATVTKEWQLNMFLVYNDCLLLTWKFNNVFVYESFIKHDNCYKKLWSSILFL